MKPEHKEGGGREGGGEALGMGDVRDDCGCLDDEGFLPQAGACVWGFAKIAEDLRCCACGGTPTGLPDAADTCANHTLCDFTRTLLPATDPSPTATLAATLVPTSPLPQQTPQPPPQGAAGGGGGSDDSAVPALVAVIVVLVLLLLCCAVAAAVLRRRARGGGGSGARDDRAGGAKGDDSVELLGGEEDCEKPAPSGGGGGGAGYGLVDVDDNAAADSVAHALANDYAWLAVGENRGGTSGVGRAGTPLATLRTRVDECVTSAIRSLKVLLRTDFLEVEVERGVVRLPAPPVPALRTTAHMRAAAAQRRVATLPPAPPPVSLFEPSPATLADSSTGELTSALRGGPPPMAKAAAAASTATSGRPKRRVYISSESDRGGGGRGLTSPAFSPTDPGGGGFLFSDDGGGGGGGGGGGNGIGGGMLAAPTRPFDPLIDSLRSRGGAWSVTSSTATAGGTVRSCLNISIPWQIRQSPHNERTHPLSRQKGELDPYESARGDVLDEMLENLNFPEAGGGGKSKSTAPASPSPLSVLAVLSRHLARDFAALPHLCAPYPPVVLLCLFLYVAPASVLDECLGWPDAGQLGVRHNKPVFLQWQFWPKLVTLLSSYALREGRRRDVPLVLSGDMQGSHPYAPGDCVCLPGLTLCSTAGEETLRASSFSAIASSYLRIPYSDLALLPPLTCLVVEDVVPGERGRHVEATVVPLAFSELMEESLRTVDGVDKRLQAEVAELERLSVGLTKVEPRRGAYGGRGGDRLEGSEVDTGRFLSG